AHVLWCAAGEQETSFRVVDVATAVKDPVARDLGPGLPRVGCAVVAAALLADHPGSAVADPETGLVQEVDRSSVSELVRVAVGDPRLAAVFALEDARSLVGI